MMTRRLLCLLAACLCIGFLSAQTNKTIRELESRRGALQRQISESEKLLQTTRKDVGSQLQGLATLTGQMEERKRYILALNHDLETIDRELSALDRRTKALQQDLKEKREEYAASVRCCSSYPPKAWHRPTAACATPASLPPTCNGRGRKSSGNKKRWTANGPNCCNCARPKANC